ncbi:hypothetical protein QBC47DRAFT_370841 [Echria macrotheca]|uniref:Uncharacterized protein n=1 Tax=Echria macrotheca TaxID=438768 RepID=A0AAJ0FEP5_9PEZI|nr:hypothetical protein QBC47DRAFT_370841 [Echria macrotheca]
MSSQPDPASPAAQLSAIGSQPVSGINVFWIVFVLGTTAAWHPLGKSVGFPNDIRRYVRVLPLTALFDTCILYGELISAMREKRASRRETTRAVVFRRLMASVPDAELISNGSNTDEGEWRRLKAMILFIGLDIRARLLANALVIFVYVKILGYYGTPLSLTVATVQFVSWVANESVLFCTYGILWARNAVRLLDAVDRSATAPSPRPLPNALAVCDRLLLTGQLIALVIIGIWVVIFEMAPSSPSTGPESPDAPQQQFWWGYNFLLGYIARVLIRPFVWYADAMNWSAHVGDDMHVILRILVFFPIVLLRCLILLIGYLALALMGLLFVLMLYPVWILLFLIYAFNWLSPFGLKLKWRRLSSIVWARIGSALGLAVLLTYYIQCWDPSGTNKAPWTENLG